MESNAHINSTANAYHIKMLQFKWHIVLHLDTRIHRKVVGSFRHFLYGTLTLNLLITFQFSNNALESPNYGPNQCDMQKSNSLVINWQRKGGYFSCFFT